jgi:hypothetical protein
MADLSEDQRILMQVVEWPKGHQAVSMSRLNSVVISGYIATCLSKLTWCVNRARYAPPGQVAQHVQSRLLWYETDRCRDLFPQSVAERLSHGSGLDVAKRSLCAQGAGRMPPQTRRQPYDTSAPLISTRPPNLSSIDQDRDCLFRGSCDVSLPCCSLFESLFHHFNVAGSKRNRCRDPAAEHRS